MQGDSMDGVTNQTHDRRYGASRWTLPGSTDRGVEEEPPAATEQANRRNNPQNSNTLSDPLNMLGTSHEQLLADKKLLLELLSQTQTELNAARQAIRDLATWTLHERTRLMSEVQLERVSGENHEVVLRQRNEEIQQLRALEQRAKLEHARTLIREGEALGQPVSALHFHKIDEMRVQAGLHRMDRFGAMQKTVTTQPGKQTGAHGEEMMHGFTHILHADTDEENESFERDEGSYSPPDIDCSLSVEDQVDQLIVEEKNKW
ncbi:hypothetical protein E8E13_005210 [Curvularia kusanoi]|uniref:Uncharacterized protein n=1 Tax=Curvularia kusanoi TaxID=90978 RepID=A0A9P4TIC5_CURKU|nr:hypothetical protein E8E13_005210 [Curvularia kusanoi]